MELEEPDIVPVHSLGYDRTRQGYEDFVKSLHCGELEKIIDGVGNIAEIRWWNADAWQMHPYSVFTDEFYPAPAGHEDCDLHFTGRMYGKPAAVQSDPFAAASHISWYVDGYFKSPETVHALWDAHGKPSERINDEENYSPGRWAAYVTRLSPYVYPMAWLTLSMHEALYEGITPARLAYHVRKNPRFIHMLMDEYCTTNEEIVRRFSEAGIEVVFYSDDLGQHGRALLSKKDFHEFILPYYKRLYGACKKRGMLIVQHTCGYIDERVPDLIDAGLSCVQSLEPNAGVDLARLKRDFGSRIAFMGGMDSGRTLAFGTPGDVAANVKACIDAAAAGGGYFAGPSHTILNAPWKNVLAFRAAIEKYRRCYSPTR